MTTPKRCEVCGLPPCNLWMTGCEGHCHCNGHPRPDDSEKAHESPAQKIIRDHMERDHSSFLVIRKRLSALDSVNPER